MSALIGYGRPDSVSHNLVGTGATFDSDPARLNSGIVSDRTAIQWLSGAQTTASALKLQSTWPSSIVPRIIPLLDLKGIPEGTKIVVTGKRAGDADFTYNLGGNSGSSSTVRTVTFDDGSVGLVVICDAGLDPIIGRQVKFLNDVNGSASIVAGSFFYPGAIDDFQGWETPAGIKRDFQPTYEGGPVEIRTPNNQPQLIPAKKAIIEPFIMSNVNFATALGSAGSPTTVTYAKLASMLLDGDVCCGVRQWQDSTGAIDQWALHRLFVYGVARDVTPPQKDGATNRFNMSFKIAQSPAGPQ